MVAPHVLDDPGGLLRQAVLASEDPVLFIESKYVLWQEGGSTPDGVLCCYGAMVPLAIEAAGVQRKGGKR